MNPGNVCPDPFGFLREPLNGPYPLVTIGIPTYNRATGYLKESIDASLRQGYPNIEVIVSDNCSPDDTERVVSGYRDPRIRYYRQRANLGIRNNYNFCLDKARGDYFLLLPDDDLIDRDFIDVCMRAAAYRTDVGIIRTGTRLIDASGSVIREIPNRVVGGSTLDFFLGWFEGMTSPYQCSTLCNTIRLKEIGGFGSRHNLFMDVSAEFKLAARWGRVDVEDVKASFRKHSEELTFATKVGHWCDDSHELLDLMCELLPQDREVIREKGLPFLAYLNYNRAKAVRSSARRFAAFLIVCRKFGFRHFPSRYHLAREVS